MEHWFDGQEIREGEAADELCGPIVEAQNANIICEHPKFRTLEGIFGAETTEVLTDSGAAKGMTVCREQGEAR